MSTKIILSADESARFAALSGDYNPIHTDPIAARRLLYGQTVVHGIHTLCRALDYWSHQQNQSQRAISLTADFKSPVYAGDALEISVEVKNDQHILLVRKQTATVMKIRLKSSAGPSISFDVADQEPPKETPLTLNARELAKAAGSVPLLLDTATATALFPDLARVLGLEMLAVLCATTRIVGMRCPGMHSLYARLQLKFTDATTAARELSYDVDSYDERFGMLELQLAAEGATGTALCYQRPAPIEQAGAAALAKRIKPQQFADQQALVIGGSRGLGRYTATLIAAGGGRVTLSYRNGKAEADEVIADITAAGGYAAALQLDTSQPGWIDRLNDFSYTHIYYFASPKILANSGDFDRELYGTYKAVFVDAVQALLDRAVAANRPIHIFMPSTIYLRDPEAGFAEYIQAKKEMEYLCNEVAAKHTDLHISLPRLPRLRTDQTAGLGNEEFTDTGDVLIPLLSEPANKWGQSKN